MAGTSIENTGRVLSKHSGEGIIEIHGKNIIIKNMSRLEKISRYG
jgi:hypothetical protein